MIKKAMYPKTKRYRNSITYITEKLDGSNIGFFKLDNELYISQRNYIYSLTEIIESSEKEIKNKLYGGLYGFLIENGNIIKESLNEKSMVFGEYIKTGKLKYDDLDKKVYLFAKANVDENFEISNLFYDLNLLKYSFIKQEIPDIFGKVPIVKIFNYSFDLVFLNELYDKYSTEKGRKVEGFVINQNDNISKYVRMKNGKMQAHFYWDINGEIRF